ncbi:hypothetical protein TUSST3_15410 [Streptomyces sp. TUS-ST3]|nr:hypothetical protein TUSST3_15410 [Streptomyces sp. TUS-ST3]
MPGWPPAVRGTCTGSLPEGLVRPESTLARAGPPSSPGKKAWTTAAALGVGTERVGAAGDDEQDDGSAGGQQGLDQFVLDARQ